MADIPFVKPESTKSKTFAFDGLSSGKTPQGFVMVADQFAPAEGGGVDQGFQDVDLTDPQYDGLNLIADHCSVALDKLAEQFKGKPKLADLICLWADRYQELEQQLANVLLLRSINTGSGVQLDRLGDNMGIFRNGVDDDPFRIRLRARAKVIGSIGTAPELIEIVRTLDNGLDPESIAYVPDYPAGFQLYMTVPAGRQLWGEQYARDFTRPATASGVRGILFFLEQDTRIFTWGESADDPAPGILTGWLEEGDQPGSGGTWAEAV